MQFRKTKYLFVKPKYLILISLTFGIILLIMTVFDIYQSRQDLYKTKVEEAFALIRAIQKAGENVYLSNVETEKLINERLVNNANLLAYLEKERVINTYQLNSIASSNQIDHIYFFNISGVLELHNTNSPYSPIKIWNNYKDEIDSLLLMKFDYFYAGTVNDDSSNQHILVLHRRLNGKGIIAVSVESDYILDFRKKIGIGRLFQKLGEEEDIKYIAIQDKDGIVTASGGIKNLSSLSNDKFLRSSINEKRILTREYLYNDLKLLEIIKPFRVEDELLGIIRIGVSLEKADKLVQRAVLRSILITALLLLVGVIILILITNNQNYSLLQSEHNRIKTYTSSILDNMNDGVIAADENGVINLFNKGAERIFNVNENDITGRNCSYLIEDSKCLIELTLKTKMPVEYWEQVVQTTSGSRIILGGSTSIIHNEDGSINTVIAVIRNLTSQRTLEANQKRQEKLSAMGELAGSIAHEIRNPLNSIGITVQRFEKEFVPSDEKEEYLELVKTMKSEVKRVSEIITQFLKFARPPKIDKKVINIKTLLQSVYKSFESQSIENKIKFSLFSEDVSVSLDSSQMHQAITNIVKNAFEAVDETGEVKLESFVENSNLIIRCSDTGKGIPGEDFGRIFNLYYTTKSHGTGFGLSIVNQVITEHGGLIRLESELNKGTVFTIELPLNETGMETRTY